MYILNSNSYLAGHTVLATKTSLLVCSEEIAAGSLNSTKHKHAMLQSAEYPYVRSDG
jgi:hypothetical protein